MRDLDILLVKCQDESFLSIYPQYVDTSNYIFEDYETCIEGNLARADLIASRYIMDLHNKKLGGLRLNIYVSNHIYDLDMIISVLKAVYCLPYLEVNIFRYNANKKIWQVHNFQMVLEMWKNSSKHCEPRTYNEAYYT